ncbi:hypothetical protein [Bradyrhizobium japonicum]|uniref:hypothetical protein n=1 Tax=Bradyrhizobium japonicum TaxID=375 RepID=UPI000462E2C4|nr:hypothetical protein [Bradyrhizobium japonicum]
MTRVQSPGYPNISLSKAIARVRAIHTADRRNPIDREVAAKHMGYSGQSGASDKMLASLAHYGLLEKAGKGQTRVSQLAVDILHPESSEGYKAALKEAAYSPSIFEEIRDRFTDGHPSEQALRSWLTRENFINSAIGPVTEAYMENCRFLEQEGAFESRGPSNQQGRELAASGEERDERPSFGGASVGDLIQWESGGALQFETPKRVRFVSEDGNWVGVEGSQTGIPMNEVIVEQKGSPPPPFIPMEKPGAALSPGESEWMRNKVGKDTNVRLLVEGEMGPKEIGKLIKLLQAQKAVLEDDDEEEETAN